MGQVVYIPAHVTLGYTLHISTERLPSEPGAQMMRPVTKNSVSFNGVISTAQTKIKNKFHGECGKEVLCWNMAILVS
jgi:hypothetical protein